MQYLNSAITLIFGWIMLPFAGLPPIAGLLFISAVMGIVMLVIFKKTSNQPAIRTARERMQGRLIEVRLFADDPVAVLRAAAGVLAENSKYLRHVVTPMLVMLVPVILLLVQAGAYYGNRPLAPGESAVVKMKLKPGSEASLSDVKLNAPPGVVIETPPVRALELNEAGWRVRAERPGKYVLNLTVGNTSIDKALVSSEGVVPAWGVRVSGGLLSVAENPGEPPLPRAAPADELRIDYPQRAISIAGRDVNWLLIFFIASIIFGFAFKPIFKVEI